MRRLILSAVLFLSGMGAKIASAQIWNDHYDLYETAESNIRAMSDLIHIGALLVNHEGGHACRTQPDPAKEECLTLLASIVAKMESASQTGFMAAYNLTEVEEFSLGPTVAAANNARLGEPVQVVTPALVLMAVNQYYQAIFRLHQARMRLLAVGTLLNDAKQLGIGNPLLEPIVTPTIDPRLVDLANVTVEFEIYSAAARTELASIAAVALLNINFGPGGPNNGGGGPLFSSKSAARSYGSFDPIYGPTNYQVSAPGVTFNFGSSLSGLEYSIPNVSNGVWTDHRRMLFTMSVPAGLALTEIRDLDDNIVVPEGTPICAQMTAGTGSDWRTYTADNIQYDNGCVNVAAYHLSLAYKWNDEQSINVMTCGYGRLFPGDSHTCAIDIRVDGPPGGATHSRSMTIFQVDTQNPWGLSHGELATSQNVQVSWKDTNPPEGSCFQFNSQTQNWEFFYTPGCIELGGNGGGGGPIF